MKKSIIVIALGMAGLLITLFAQNNKPALKEQYKEAERLYNLDEPTTESDSTALVLFLKIAKETTVTNTSLAVDCFIKAGNIHQGYQRFAAANELYHKAIYLNNKQVKSPAANYEAFLYLGSSLYFSNKIDSAQYYFEAASDIATAYQNKEVLPEQDRLYNSLGAIYYESANYLQAKNYFTKALESSSTTADDYEELYTGVQSNIANCLMKLNQYDAALQIFKSLAPNEQQKNIILQNTAHSYFELGRYDSALTIYQSLPVQNNFSSLLALTDMGRIYMNRRQWQQAEVIFDSAIARNKNISKAIKNKEEALAYFYRSRLAEEQGLLDEAITWNNEALQEVHLSFAWKNNDDLPQNVSQTVSPITLFRILHAKAVLLYKRYLLSKQEMHLAASLAACRKAIETANYIKQNFDNDEAKLFFNDNYRRTYNEAINIAYTAAAADDKYARDYFFIIENYKGSILYQNLKNVQLKSTAQLPDSIRQREKEIKQLLAVYTTRINQNTVEKEAKELQKKLLSLQVELSRLQKKYEQDATYNLYKNQQADGQLSLSNVQSQLDDNTALLNYYAGDSSIYCFVITKEKLQFEKINTNSSFRQSYKEFTGEIYNYEEGRRYEGFSASARLYNYLITPVIKTAGSCDNWVIIPDGFLYYLPFDALMQDEKNKNYLVSSKTISYHYSFALLFGTSTHHTGGDNKGTVAFAPYIKTDESINTGNLPELPLSGEELKEISTNIYTGSKADKQGFLKEATQYPVIHLATHASVGSDSSSNWIQFYPSDSTDINNKLFVHEIYNLDLHQAELVILSACETGGGRDATGEGLLSLSRAFMYAGADGIVSTLWRTEDRVTAFLMQRMHVYLKQKIAPEKALQMAKKDLLNNKAMGSQYKTPNYWANFIYAGKLNSKPKQNQSWWWWVGSFIVVAATGFFIYSKRKKASSIV
jgi:CHAT domain-containing protein/tetratricopeptide (TPR) repeat protein